MVHRHVFGELLMFEMKFDWKAGMMVVSGSEWWVVGECELDVTAQVVNMTYSKCSPLIRL